MNKSYSDKQKKNALQYFFPPHNKLIREVSEITGIPKSTLNTWRLKFLDENTTMPNKNSKPLSKSQQFNAIVETAQMTQPEIADYCRKLGIYPDDLIAWKQAFIKPVDPDLALKQSLQDEIKKRKSIEKDLNRKDKALAETAALLVLQKKAQSIWGQDEDL
jgi:transposase